jgi:hypothetical protein
LSTEIQLDPHRGTPQYKQAIVRIHHALTKTFASQHEKAIAAAKRALKAVKAGMLKAEDDASDYDPDEVADEIYENVEQEWKGVPAEVYPALHQAMLSGITTGILQLELHEPTLISEANTVASDYARARAAELVGMKEDDEGNLVENENAEWAISDTTRDKIRSIVTNGFEGETDIKVIRQKIQQALEDDQSGIFSIERASMIANTEVATAQSKGNYDVWQKSGMVEKLKWSVSDEGPCDVCEDNEDETVDIGKPFPSGDLCPPAHPDCRCVCFVQKLSGSDEGDDT